jgi:hypothetical protein
MIPRKALAQLSQTQTQSQPFNLLPRSGGDVEDEVAFNVKAAASPMMLQQFDMNSDDMTFPVVGEPLSNAPEKEEEKEKVKKRNRQMTEKCVSALSELNAKKQRAEAKKKANQDKDRGRRRLKEQNKRRGKADARLEEERH